MATRLQNSKAEDAFAELLEERYGLIEGWLDDNGELVEGHFVREHTFDRRFVSPASTGGTSKDGEHYRTRVDFWFPQWSIVVEFKAAPLGRHYNDKAWAERAVEALQRRGRRMHEQVSASWSNQLAKFKDIVAQADGTEETAGILWILVDDQQMSKAQGCLKKYTYRDVHQVKALRETHRQGYGWNPMGARECGRLLYMYKEVSEMSAQSLCGQAYYDSLSMMQQVGLAVQIENTKRMILPELHTLDTTVGLHLVLGYDVVMQEDSCCEEVEGISGIAPCGTCGAAGGGADTELVDAKTAPLIIAPQK